MFDELLEFLDSNWELNSLKYIEYTKKVFNEMNLGFDYVYEKLLKELNEKKDNKLSDRLMHAKKVFENNSKIELENQFLNICDIYETYVLITEANELLNFFDEVKNIPFFHMVDSYVGNRHMYTFFNKHLRNFVRSNSDTSVENLRIAIKSVLESTTKYIDAEQNGIDKLIDDINKVPKEKIQLTLNQYYKVEDNRPVNSFRRKVLVDLLEDIELTVDAVEKQIIYLKSTGAHNWKPFSIIAGLYYYLFDLHTNEIKLEKLITELFNRTNLTEEYKFKKVFTQKGAQNYGAGFFGVCFLKEKFRPSKTNQIVFDITDKVEVAYYNAFDNKFINGNKIDVSSPTLEQDIVEGFINAAKTFEEHEIYKNINKQIIENIEYLNDHKQLIIDGAPGTGKSYGVNTEVKENNINHERVTFYSDYEYHNFIGSILPKLNGETVTYEFVKGPFTKLLNDALSNPEDKHYLIVEELTRGNAAAIFGDIFQLLDRTEEGWSEYPITHNNILESLDPEVRTFLENEYEGKVVLPPNLSIICTINSSDQNVYPLDTAFKRRFDYKIESTNVHDNFVDYEIKFGTDITVSWQDFYQKLNKYILVDLGLKEDKQVGPYFIKNHKDDNKKLESIQTKLAMYMWNDLHKVHTISNKTIFKDVHTLYEVDNLFRTGSREQILNILSTEFKQHFNLKDSSDLTE